MHVDLLYEIEVPKPWPDGQRAAEHAAFHHTIEQVKLADKVGFNTAWFVEHHFREQRSHSSAPEVMIGALSQVTENIHLGFGVTLTPYGFTHPVRIAEKVATADHLARGRIQWGTGRSSPLEQLGFGVPVGDESKKQWREAVKNVVEIWKSERFSSDTEYLKMPPRAVVPKPFQEPHPHPWLAASSESSAQTAGKAGLGLLSFSILRPMDDLARHVATYRRAAASPEPITDVTNNAVAVYTLVHVADSVDDLEKNKAWDAVWWWYQNLAEFILLWESEGIPDADKEKLFPLLKGRADGNFDPREFGEQDMIIVGDVDQCLEKMVKYAELGVERLICFVGIGSLSQKSVLRSIELIGTKLRPELERLNISSDAIFKFVGADTEVDQAITIGPGGISR